MRLSNDNVQRIELFDLTQYKKRKALTEDIKNNTARDNAEEHFQRVNKAHNIF